MGAQEFTLQLAPWMIAAVAIIVVLGSIVQSGLGMGFGLMVAPLLALLDPALVPAPTLFLGMFTAAWGAYGDRALIRWNEVAIGSAGRFTGVAAGLLLLFFVSDEAGFSLLFGIMVLTAVLLSVAGRAIAFNNGSLAVMGFVSGTMGTITSVGAPPLALIYHGRGAATARATLAAFFMIGCAGSLIGLYAAGWAGMRDLALAVAMLPPMLLGLWLSRHLRLRFARWYRPWLLSVAGVAGLLLVVRGLLQ
ncbi:TSUP family transporter [Nitratireductor sp. XY-223]|uniref:TSUP family transporter n=1 Tax=Nitratireductor sp. XY-223 TaxID=2561926 RepID=UPI0010A9E231|nr:TSUP family transporter [Nitratireductor sp. XY-223]